MDIGGRVGDEGEGASDMSVLRVGVTVGVVGVVAPETGFEGEAVLDCDRFDAIGGFGGDGAGGRPAFRVFFDVWEPDAPGVVGIFRTTLS